MSLTNGKLWKVSRVIQDRSVKYSIYVEVTQLGRLWGVWWTGKAGPPHPPATLNCVSPNMNINHENLPSPDLNEGTDREWERI